jgi:hypothetical protein
LTVILICALDFRVASLISYFLGGLPRPLPLRGTVIAFDIDDCCVIPVTVGVLLEDDDGKEDGIEVVSGLLRF